MYLGQVCFWEVEYVPWAGLFLGGGVCTLGTFVVGRWSMCAPCAGLFLGGGVCTLGRFVLGRWSKYLGQVCS